MVSHRVSKIKHGPFKGLPSLDIIAPDWIKEANRPRQPDEPMLTEEELELIRDEVDAYPGIIRIREERRILADRSLEDCYAEIEFGKILYKVRSIDQWNEIKTKAGEPLLVNLKQLQEDRDRKRKSVKDYEKIVEKMPVSAERIAKQRKYYDIKKKAGEAFRKDAARYRDHSNFMCGPGGPNDIYEGMDVYQVIEKSYALFYQAEQAEREAIAAYEEKKLEP